MHTCIKLYSDLVLTVLLVLKGCWESPCRRITLQTPCTQKCCKDIAMQRAIKHHSQLRQTQQSSHGDAVLKCFAAAASQEAMAILTGCYSRAQKVDDAVINARRQQKDRRQLETPADQSPIYR